jgi:hypothetical protein
VIIQEKGDCFVIIPISMKRMLIIQGKGDRFVIIPVSMKRELSFSIPLNIPCLTRVYCDKFT